MTSERIKEIQEETGLQNSTSVYLALMKVWNECAQEKSEPRMFSEEEICKEPLPITFLKWLHKEGYKTNGWDDSMLNTIYKKFQSLSPKEGKEESANYVARVCEKHFWGLVETTATGQEPKTNIQCLYCGANKENGFKHTEPNQTEAEKDVSGSLIYSYLRFEYAQQLERMEKIGINVNTQFFEQCVNTLLLMVEQKQCFDAVSKNKLSLARKQVIEEIEEFVEKESISATDEGGVFYENVIDSDYLLTKLQTLKQDK